MKIGIDARITSENTPYAHFVQELVSEFIQQNSEHEITVYTKENLALKRESFFDDIKAKKIFEQEKFHLMIFFDHHVPHGYSWEYIVLLEWLKEVFFPKKKYISRKIYSHRLKKSLSHCKRVVMLDPHSAMELNEHLNIHEDKIETIPGFFPNYQNAHENPLLLDIRKKHNLPGKYLIYDSGNELHHNFDRILKALTKIRDAGIPLSLLVLCDDTNKDIEIRNKVLEYNISDRILFLGEVSSKEEKFYYEQSSGVIFSSIYESFPFQFQKALFYHCPLLANDIPGNRYALWEYISYLDPLSIHAMVETIKSCITTPQSSSLTKLPLSREKSAQKLWDLVNMKN
jgi:glycosyltransferase involved in cell wall biosynthesis